MNETKCPKCGGMITGILQLNEERRCEVICEIGHAHLITTNIKELPNICVPDGCYPVIKDGWLNFEKLAK
jgi:hypothetical protein